MCSTGNPSWAAPPCSGGAGGAAAQPCWQFLPEAASSNGQSLLRAPLGPLAWTPWGWGGMLACAPTPVLLPLFCVPQMFWGAGERGGGGGWAVTGPAFLMSLWSG